jgi:hypothetical protein
MSEVAWDRAARLAWGTRNSEWLRDEEFLRALERLGRKIYKKATEEE